MRGKTLAILIFVIIVLVIAGPAIGLVFTGIGQAMTAVGALLQTIGGHLQAFHPLTP